MFQTSKSKVATIFQEGTKALICIRRERERFKETMSSLLETETTTSTRENRHNGTISMCTYYKTRLDVWKILEISLKIVIDNRNELVKKHVPLFLRQPLANIAFMSDEEPRVRTFATFLSKYVREFRLRDIMKRTFLDGVDPLLYMRNRGYNTAHIDTEIPPSPSSHTPVKKTPGVPPCAPPISTSNDMERTPLCSKVQCDICPMAPVKTKRSLDFMRA
jgi:hypothetical protein